MSGGAVTYVIQQLASTGFAVLGSQTAFKLRPDLWATALNAASDFNEMPRLCASLAAQSGAQLYRVKFIGDATATLLIARCRDDLEKRVRWVTGLHVASVELHAQEAAKALPVIAAGGEELPNYPCTRRTEMLAEMGLTEEMYAQQSHFATAGRPRF